MKDLEFYLSKTTRISIKKDDWRLIVNTDGRSDLSSPSSSITHSLKYPAGFFDFNKIVDLIKKDIVSINPSVIDKNLQTIYLVTDQQERIVIQVKNEGKFDHFFEECILKTTNPNVSSLNKILDECPIPGLEKIRFSKTSFNESTPNPFEGFINNPSKTEITIENKKEQKSSPTLQHQQNLGTFNSDNTFYIAIAFLIFTVGLVVILLRKRKTKP